MASDSIPSSLLVLISNLNSFISIKLDSSNYIIWRSQVQNSLKATGYLGFVTGSTPQPPSTIKNAENQEIENPEFKTWELIDAHLFSCITSTISPPIFATILNLSHSSEIWMSLERKFTSLSRSHIHQLKNKLQSITKKSQSIEEYLRQIKEISDQLSLAASSVDDEDLILQILNGLPDEYNAFKTTI